MILLILIGHPKNPLLTRNKTTYNYLIRYRLQQYKCECDVHLLLCFSFLNENKEEEEERERERGKKKSAVCKRLNFSIHAKINVIRKSFAFMVLRFNAGSL